MYKLTVVKSNKAFYDNVEMPAFKALEKTKPYPCGDTVENYQHEIDTDAYDSTDAVGATDAIQTVTFGGISYDVTKFNLTIADIQDLEGLLIGLANEEGTYYFGLNYEYDPANTFAWDGTDVTATVVGQFETLTVVTSAGTLTATSTIV